MNFLPRPGRPPRISPGHQGLAPRPTQNSSLPAAPHVNFLPGAIAYRRTLATEPQGLCRAKPIPADTCNSEPWFHIATVCRVLATALYDFLRERLPRRTPRTRKAGRAPSSLWESPSRASLYISDGNSSPVCAPASTASLAHSRRRWSAVILCVIGCLLPKPQQPLFDRELLTPLDYHLLSSASTSK